MMTQNTGIGTLDSATLTYDAHGRDVSMTDARGIVTQKTYDNLDRVTSQTISGGGLSQTTSNVLNNVNQRIQTILPDSEVVNYEYHPTGELKKQFGSKVYPVEHGIDNQGRPKTLKTWKDFQNDLGAAITTWNYSSNRGFLTSKQYPDGNGPSYTYTLAGRDLTRTWARGVATTYSRSNSGEVSGIDYSDTTPAVASVYDRRGRRISVSGGIETLSTTYNDAGQSLTETHTGGPLDGISVSSSYDSLFRRSSLSIFNLSSVISHSYAYDSASRLSSVSDGAHSADYGYLPNSSLVSGLTFKQGTTTRMTTSKSYDGLNRLIQISSAPSADSVRNSSYSYNDANQRTRVDLADGSYWIYEYDFLGQVTSGKKFFSDNTEVPGQQFEYGFDTIGNRTSTTANGHSASYTANALNQYENRTVPGFVAISGTAQADATVTVNNESVTRHGEFFHKELSLDNVSAPVFSSVSIVGVKNNVGPNGEDAVTEEKGFVFIPKAQVNPTKSSAATTCA